MPLPANPAPTSTLTPTPHIHTTGLWRSMRSWLWPCAAPTASAPSRWSASRPDVIPRQPAGGAARRPPPMQPHCLLSLAPCQPVLHLNIIAYMQWNTEFCTTACMGNSRGSAAERRLPGTRSRKQRNRRSVLFLLLLVELVGSRQRVVPLGLACRQRRDAGGDHHAQPPAPGA